jgi:hypothetical protein
MLNDIKPFTLFYNTGSYCAKGNCKFPRQAKIANQDELLNVVEHDHVAQYFTNYYASIENFLSADCLILDVDNSHSDDPMVWQKPQHLATHFPNTMFYTNTSRNHNIVKNGKTARPKFHVIFPLSKPITNAEEYRQLAIKAQTYYSAFDENAINPAHKEFGSKNTEIECFTGELCLDTFLEGIPTLPAIGVENVNISSDDFICEGDRNNTLHSFAVSMFKKHGVTKKAYEVINEKNTLCVPPLPP